MHSDRSRTPYCGRWWNDFRSRLPSLPSVGRYNPCHSSSYRGALWALSSLIWLWKPFFQPWTTWDWATLWTTAPPFNNLHMLMMSVSLAPRKKMSHACCRWCTSSEPGPAWSWMFRSLSVINNSSRGRYVEEFSPSYGDQAIPSLKWEDTYRYLGISYYNRKKITIKKVWMEGI